ncbi:hypothetical protein J1G43_05595 [Cellulomonas sp. zg-ZUI22]|uniref:prealbumin-like fold domain-containing protein n=1 Tax=Cellulomonas sp. zg-ZUI22 TaxID=2816955 RepID=UPI001A94868A|nr:VWA domain-containing protein [Cellulomonas sp. zg-ZUI22]MBO0899434.1 hypothetical protein [Cellulomonas sp. zg-ZUI22]
MDNGSRRLRRIGAALASAALALGLAVPVALVGAPPAEANSPAAAPLAVPPATGDNAVITVRVGADRQGTTGVSGLAGVTLQLYDGTTAPTTPVADAWATCVSDADGDCSFVVPDTETGLFGCQVGAGANCDRRFWVVQTGVPEGFTQNSTLRTGNGDGSGSQLTPYQFRTGSTLRAGNTYTSQSNFMIGTGGTNRSASGGVWQQSRTNPAPLQQCGLRVALILDLSGSVTSQQLVSLKAAADTFTNSLVGTPSEMALFSFSTGSPAAGATQNYPGLTSVSTQAGADEFTSRYASWTATGGTNWDRGIAAAAEAAASYDVAVVITDGDPTFYSQPAEGPGNFTRFREMENGIFSANALKAQDTRVLAVGVGAGVSDPATAQNLAAISGPTAYDGTNTGTADYFQVADYTVVGQALRQLALGDCTGSLSVVKQLVDASGDLASATPAGAGWTFGASTSTAGVTLPTTSATTDASSAVNFPITYAGGTATGTIEVQEEAQEGAVLFPVAGANAVCTDLVTGQGVTVTNVGAAGFTVDVPNTDAVSCTVYNQVAAPATVTVDKEWVIDGAAPVPNGNQPPGFTSELTLTGPGADGATSQAWGVTRPGYVAGESVTVDEQVVLQAPDIDPDLCVVSTPQVVEIDGAAVDPTPVPTGGYGLTLIEGANTLTLRNTVDCESRLTLAKYVEEGTADPTLWDLAALPAPDAPAGQLPGPAGTSGSAGATDVPITPGVAYQLAESGGPATYLQVDQRSDLQEFPASTGSWSCIRVDTEGNQISGFADGLNGGVTAPIAARVLCTATNQTAQLTLVKEVVNQAGGTAVPSDFTLRATPGTTPEVEGLTEIETPGAAEADAQTFEIRPGHPYTVSETGPAGYEQTDLECLVNGTAVNGTEITAGRGESVVCTFTNADDPASLTLRKAVDAGSTGATQTPADWTLTATLQGTGEQDPVSGNGADGVTDVEVLAGTYALSESTVAGFDAGAWECVDAGGDEVAVDDDAVVLANGASVTCTVTNTAQQPTLTLVKELTNDQGGTSGTDDWTLTADGPTAGVSGVTGEEAVTGAPVAIGSYALSESGPAGYTAGEWTCADDGGAVPVTDDAVEIGLGQDVTCTITNDDQPAALTLRKVVDVGTTGATQTPADWTLTATPQDIEGQDPVSGDGADGVTAVEVFAGTYALSESTVAGFTAGTWGCVDADGGTVAVDGGAVTIGSGTDVTCTITNTAQPSTLTLVKQVVNDEGGTAAATDWTLTAAGPTTGLTGVTGDAAITAAPVAIGTYTLNESGPAGYAAGDWVCATDETSVPVADGAVEIALGQDVTCTITNDDQPAALTLRKVVEAGTTGATQTPADWTLTATPQGIEGQAPVSGDGADGVTGVGVFAGTYALSESTVAGFTAGTWGCVDAAGTAVAVEADAVTLTTGADVTCTITNTAQGATLTLVKQVTADDGGTAVPGDWTLTATGPTTGLTGATGDPAITDAPVAIGTYALTESGPAGYTPGDWTCATDETTVPVTDGSVTVALGQAITCTVVNDDQPGTLTLVKQVTNDSGGTAEPTDWTLSADGPTTGVTGATGSTAVTDVEVAAGDYALSEADGPAGYTASAWTCEGGALNGTTVTIANGATVTCTITNDDQPAALTLRKVVDTGATGAPQTPADWTVRAAPEDIPGQEVVEGNGADGVTGVAVFAGTYALSESFVPGYEAGEWGCVDAGGADVPLDQGSLTLANGADVTCTITNTAVPSTLTLVKQVTNDDGGTADARDWVLTATGPTTSHSGATGDDAITSTEVEYGSHTLSESGGPSGYTTNDWACENDEGDLPVESGAVLLDLGQDVTCTVLNDDQPATLTLVKEVVNDHGGDAEATDWTLTADGPTTGVTGETGSDTVTGVDVSAGDYTLSEADGPADYTASDWSCEGGTLDGDTVTVANGEAVTCTVTNTFAAPRLTLVKDVLNEQGGTATPEEWTLRAEGPETVTGATRGPTVTDVPVTPGAYTLSEVDGPEGYTQVGWVCEDAAGPVAVDGDVLELAAGDDVTCTVTNTDAQATAPWTAVKSSDPPSGTEVQPGQVVTYTVTLSPVDPGGEIPEFLVTDDLTDVVDDATLIEDSIETTTGGVAVAQGGVELVWSGGPVAGTQTLTYRVRVDDDVNGQVLRNVVTAPGAEPCVDDADVTFAVAALADVTFAVAALADEVLADEVLADEECRTTTHPTPTRATPGGRPGSAGTSDRGWLSSTGGPGAGLALVALWLVAGGAALVGITRRRESGGTDDESRPDVT